METATMVLPKMAPEPKRLLLEALRSGDFAQCRNKLTGLNPDTQEVVGHCCLGVATEVAIKDGVKVPTEKGFDTLRYFDTDPGFNGARSGTPPTQVAKWMGFAPSSEGYDEVVRLLINLNDKDKKDFAYIAKWVEKNL